jgi:hypothetical protein
MESFQEKASGWFGSRSKKDAEEGVLINKDAGF